MSAGVEKMSNRALFIVFFTDFSGYFYILIDE